MKLIPRFLCSATRVLAALAFLTAAVQIAPEAFAQGYFVPGQPPAQQPPRPAQPARPAPRPAAQPQAPGPDQDNDAPIQIPLPPIPDLPLLPRGPSPPAAVLGVIAVPDVMRASTAAQDIDKVIGDRRQKLNADAQAAQQAWRDLQQALTNDRAKLSPDQLRVREKELQDRINNDSKALRARDRIIQEATQVAINTINANLLGIIRQVADSRGINLVLHRQGSVLNAPEFDLTDQVVAQLNKLLPTVTVTPDGVSPLAQTASTPPALAPATPPKK